MLSDAIGLFDSGVGGLSIWREIKLLLPGENTIYIADQKHLPYGEKSTEEIRERATKISKFLLGQGCSLIVVACNSATVSALSHLRRRFPVPFVGVEPAVKPAAAETKTGEICVLATTKTATSNRQRSLIKQHAKRVAVRILSAPEFVELVENGDTNSPETFRKLKNFFSRHSLGKSDVLVLGCTHYIFLKNTIKSCINSSMMIIEPSQSVAKRVKWLRLNQGKTTPNKVGEHTFFTTDNAERFSNVAEKLLGESLTRVTELKI